MKPQEEVNEEEPKFDLRPEDKAVNIDLNHLLDSFEKAAKRDTKRIMQRGATRNDYAGDSLDHRRNSIKKTHEKNKKSINSESSYTTSKLSQSSRAKPESTKPALIDLNINMNSLNDSLSKIVETINQHALLLNNISGNCTQKLDKDSFRALYKSAYTKDVIQNWQTLLGRDHMKALDKAQKERGTSRKESSADIALKKADDTRALQGSQDKLLKEFLYYKEFPSFIMSSVLRLSDDIRYTYEETQKNNAEFKKMMDSLKNELKAESKTFENKIEEHIETLHQSLITSKDEQAKFLKETDLKIEEVEKKTLWKMNDFSDLLENRPTKEFVRDTTQMECDKIRSQIMKEFNTHIPKLERSVKTTKDAFIIFKDETTQKVGKVQTEMNNVKEEIKQTEVTFLSKNRKIQEDFQQKFTDLDETIKKFKENDKMKQMKINKCNDDIKQIKVKIQGLKKTLENASSPDLGHETSHGLSQSVSQTIENYVKSQIESNARSINDKIDEVRKSAIDEAMEMTQSHQAKFLDKFAENGNQNDEEVLEMLGEKIKSFESKIESERILIQKKFQKLLTDLNIDEFLDSLEEKLDAKTYHKFKEQCEIKLKAVDKKSKINEKGLTQLEKFVENLALAISNIEKHNHEIIIDPAATKKNIGKVCLSCGVTK
ncbi:unnamed protein product [Moneuplotes crassus]|uniref:Uncharacterized protein n=1 Tax=Euplotes crassus TaxID=5936 RepID=A0AAD1U2U4_EUPCR|nr:unnamed protein product [Moneuplotes crassus]